MELHPGLLIRENVRLARPLSSGGMGSVWVADHLTLGTQVAVKFIHARLAHDAPSLGRFTREATSAARIRSPHVVQVLDHGVLEGLPFIVMELLQGEDLERRLQRDGPLKIDETATIVQQVGKALSDAHALGIVHRDIKPPNVFLSQSAGEVFVKLLDFGIAKHTDEAGANMTSSGQVVGTPTYMSPEQIFSVGTVDHRSDLWSLGVLAYECLTGRTPFRGARFGDVSVAIHGGVFEPASLHGAPPALDAWFVKALARDQNLRFGSARELVEAFMRLSRGGGGVELVATPSRRGLSRTGRRAVVVGALGFSVSAGVTLLLLSRRTPSEIPSIEGVEAVETTGSVSIDVALPEPAAVPHVASAASSARTAPPPVALPGTIARPRSTGSASQLPVRVTATPKGRDPLF